MENAETLNALKDALKVAVAKKDSLRKEAETAGRAAKRAVTLILNEELDDIDGEYRGKFAQLDEKHGVVDGRIPRTPEGDAEEKRQRRIKYYDEYYRLERECQDKREVISSRHNLEWTYEDAFNSFLRRDEMDEVNREIWALKEKINDMYEAERSVLEDELCRLRTRYKEMFEGLMAAYEIDNIHCCLRCAP